MLILSIISPELSLVASDLSNVLSCVTALKPEHGIIVVRGGRLNHGSLDHRPASPTIVIV